MEQSIQLFAQEVRNSNRGDRLKARFCFGLWFIACVVYAFRGRGKYIFGGIHEWSLLVILQGYFTYRFYRIYLVVRRKNAIKQHEQDVELYKLMRVHNISVKRYFGYITEKIAAYWIVQFVMFIGCAVLSGTCIIGSCAAICGVILSWLVAVIYFIYYCKKVQKRSGSAVVRITAFAAVVGECFVYYEVTIMIMLIIWYLVIHLYG